MLDDLLRAVLPSSHSGLLIEAQIVTFNLDQFYPARSRALALLYRKGKKAIPAVETIKKEALRRKHGETIRDCDFHLAIVLQDESRLLHLYFGTPFAQYRRRLLSRFGRTIEIPETFLWKHSQHKTDGPVIDLFAGRQSISDQIALKPGQVIHRALCSLVTDFYRPIRTAALYSSIYPDDYFNPATSPQRVAQVVIRLRRWLKTNRFPLEIQEEQGSYRIQSTAPCLLKLHRDLSPSRSEQHLLWRLRELPAGASFTVHDVSNHLKIPLWTARRLLKLAREKESIYVQGEGHDRKYSIKKG